MFSLCDLESAILKGFDRGRIWDEILLAFLQFSPCVWSGRNENDLYFQLCILQIHANLVHSPSQIFSDIRKGIRRTICTLSCTFCRCRRVASTRESNLFHKPSKKDSGLNLQISDRNRNYSLSCIFSPP
jgi:hypothetical protein